MWQYRNCLWQRQISWTFLKGICWVTDVATLCMGTVLPLATFPSWVTPHEPSHINLSDLIYVGGNGWPSAHDVLQVRHSEDRAGRSIIWRSLSEFHVKYAASESGDSVTQLSTKLSWQEEKWARERPQRRTPSLLTCCSAEAFKESIFLEFRKAGSF